MEVLKFENVGHYRDDMLMSGDIFLLQVSSLFFNYMNKYELACIYSSVKKMKNDYQARIFLIL